MTKPINIRGIAQETIQIHAGQTFPLGTRMHVNGGRIFRYARAGSNGIATARVCQANKQEEALKNLSVLALTEVGAQSLTVGLSRNTDLGVNALTDSLVFVTSGTGAGTIYHISGNNKWLLDNSVNITDTTITITIDRITTIEHDTTTRLSILRSLYDGVTRSDAPNTEAVTGIAPVAVTANYYFWLQTGGPAVVLQQDELVKGLPVSASESTQGAVEVSRVVIPTSTSAFGLNAPSERGLRVVRQLAVGAQAGVGNGAKLAPTSGEAVVPDVSIGYALEPTASGEYALVYLTLDN